MKKFLIGLTLTMAMSAVSVPAFASPSHHRNNNYAAQHHINNNYVATQQVNYMTSQQVMYDESTALENYLLAQEARIFYLQDLYDRGLITKVRYDLSIANIEERINYVLENGLGISYDSYGGYDGYGCVGGYSGCGRYGIGW